MKNLKSIWSFLLLAAMVLFAGCEQNTDPNLTGDANQNNLSTGENVIIPGQYIVVLKNDVIPDVKFKAEMPYAEQMDIVKDIASKFVKEVTGEGFEPTHAYHRSIKGFAGKLSMEAVEMLKKDPRVLRIEPDQIVVLAPPPGKGPGGGGGDGGGGGSTTEETPWGIGRVNGGVTYTGENVAWIIDSGIDLDHEDLNVDVARSESFLGSKTNPDDQNGHGTHVAGTVAAIGGNSKGVIGVAAGATVVSVRVLDRRGSGSLSGVIAGVNYVGANAASGDVANMSLGGGISPSLDDAVVNASKVNGCKFAVAAGNSSANANNHSPARANGTYVYTVSAMSSGDKWASFSNYGNPPIDYCEPGVSIKSCWKDNGYNTISGTSMATPHLAGILLLGSVRTDGYVNGDPDGNADPIGVH